jgi:NAD(P)-dependent dehydrogenase (short-subunit alcohol dehydrogenase family)
VAWPYALVMAPLAVVTGGNRGLGFEVCRELGRRELRVLLGSRDARAGETAAATLRGEGLEVEARALDVADARSVAAFAAGVSGPVDVLVCNAGASFRGFDAGLAERTLATNYFGAAAVMDALLPAMAQGGRIVMVSSGMGELSALGPELRARFLAPELDRAGVDALAHEFVEDVRRGEHGRHGWPANAYRVSKALMNALVRVTAPALRARGIKLNAVCPGWVRTDMGGAAAPRSLEEGAAGIVWAATLPADGPSGGFFRDGRAIGW